ncbi:MAG TPA: helix-turn-helix transcriptional regulator [Candidatus Competibacter sp.]|nr:helix-turn-helix transcriptional regulator [Candidatus Competibacter sp.]HRW64757.1 helix-turn-helix transcriptional regulator [Candidatus Competibacter sp.]
MKRAKALASLRQLCCLGLSREILIPELLHALHMFIPSENNVFNGLDEHLLPTFVIPEFVIPEVVETLQSEWHRLYVKPFHARALAWYNHHRVMPDVRILDERFYRSDFYHVVFRPYNQHYRIQMILKSNGAMVGGISLARSQHQQPFDAEDIQQLRRLLPYVEHSLQARNEPVVDYVDSGQTGLVILKRNGSVVHLSDSARHLLFLATYGAVPVGQEHVSLAVTVPPVLRQLCANLDGIFQGLDAPPPSFSHTNGSGRFVFRAYWLQPPTIHLGLDARAHPPSDDGLMGVLIEHQEPLRLQLHRKLQGWRLSPREQEVGLALAEGLSQTAIAARLNISVQTVITYVRRLYAKLEVHNRAELLDKLRTLTSKTVQL